MSCTSLLTQGFTLDCADGIGGISEILIANTENVTAFTESAGEVTAITQVASTNFYLYKLDDEVAMIDTVETKSENGTIFFESNVSFTMRTLSKEKSTELKLMAVAPNLIVIAKLNDGRYVVVGLDKITGTGSGVRKFGGTNNATSGKAFGDFNGYAINLNCKERHYPYFVATSVIAGLTIA